MTLRRALPLLLAVIVAFSSVQMAVARGQAAPAGSMVICAGQGFVTVLVDAEGQPTGAVHLCPDCALSLFSAPLPEIPQTPVVLARTSPDWPCIGSAFHATPALTQNARAPPCLI